METAPVRSASGLRKPAGLGYNRIGADAKELMNDWVLSAV
jgi:hypothetical protein